MKTTPKRTRHPNYPWAKWIRAGGIRLKRGRDYVCTDRSMAQQIRNAAYRAGIRASVTPWLGGVVAKFSGEG